MNSPIFEDEPTAEEGERLINRGKAFRQSLARRKEYNLRKMKAKLPPLEVTPDMKTAQSTAFTKSFSTKVEAEQHAEKGWGPQWSAFIIVSAPIDGTTGYSLKKRFRLIQ